VPQIESVLRTILLADTTVSPLVSTRIYQTRLPAVPTFPAVTYQMIDRPQDPLTGITTARIQYTCMATTWAKAAELADAIRCALHGYKGTTGDVRIYYIRYVEQHDDYDETSQIYWIPVDVLVTYLDLPTT